MGYPLLTRCCTPCQQDGIPSPIRKNRVLPLRREKWGYSPVGKDGVFPHRPDGSTPNPLCLETDSCENITSRHPSDTGGKKRFNLRSFSARQWQSCYIRRLRSNSSVLYLINCGNKSKSFLSFISFILVSQHRVQVSCTSSNTSKF